MAEKSRPEGEEAVEAAEAAAPLETNAVGVAVALDEARANPDLKDEVQAFLRKQSALVDGQLALVGDQRHHLHEQFKQLKVKHFGERLKVALQLFAAASATVVGVAVGALAWQAHEASGVVIQAFSVPPDLAQRGLTGEVVASKLLDDLATMQAATNSGRPASSYANNWNGDIKVEIPETGVSLGELRRLLVDWLGRQTVIDGEVYHGADGLVLAARTGDQPAKEHAGQEADLDGLVQAAAEDIYIATQPYRAAVYLMDHGRKAEAVSLMQASAAQGPAVERAWAYRLLANIESEQGGTRAALPLHRRGSALAPELEGIISNILVEEKTLGHPEAALAGYPLSLAKLKNPARAGVAPDQVAEKIARDTSEIAALHGDYAAGLAPMRALDEAGQMPRNDRASYLVPLYTDLHELMTARTNLALLDTPEGGFNRRGNKPIQITEEALLDRARLASAAEDWNGVLMLAPLVEPILAQEPGFKDRRAAQFDPLIAYAKARTGDMAGANALIATTPTDSYDALIVRAKISALTKDWAAVDRWFGEAVRQNPSIPMAYAQWGEVLLAKGDVDGAIAKLKLSHKKGPHFADPLETWGEALMAQGDDRGAISKFKQANKYAPRWGRLHLKWAQALAKAGDTAGARSQAKTAAGLDLTPTERAELAAQRF